MTILELSPAQFFITDSAVESTKINLITVHSNALRENI